jgi:predicted dehydrogenase
VDVTDRLRAGIIGVGFMGRVHAQAARVAGADIVAVASSSPQAAAEGAAALGAERAALTSQELIDSADIDVVHVCTPNSAHRNLAAAALASGKHVICEKPLATTLADAQLLAGQARSLALVASVPFVYRYYPLVREARARIAADEAGPLHFLHGEYLQDWLADEQDSNWRVDPVTGGPSRAFADIGVHWCDLMEFVTGHRISRLVAHIKTVLPERHGPVGWQRVETEDVAMVTFETDRGASGSVAISQATLGAKNRLRFSFDGPRASYAFDQESPDVLIVGGKAANTIVPRDPAVLSAAARPYVTVPAGHPQGYQDSFNLYVADVYAVISGEARDGLATFADGLRAAELTAAVLESARTRTWVEVS